MSAATRTTARGAETRMVRTRCREGRRRRGRGVQCDAWRQGANGARCALRDALCSKPQIASLAPQFPPRRIAQSAMRIAQLHPRARLKLLEEFRRLVVGLGVELLAHPVGEAA